MSAAPKPQPLPPAPGKLTKSYTQVPNAYFDRLWRCCTPSEYAVLGVINRLTWGFHKTEREIPVSRFMKILDMKERTVFLALAGVKRKNLAIQRATKGKTSTWAINPREYRKVEEIPHLVDPRPDTDKGPPAAMVILNATCLACGQVGPCEATEEEIRSAFESLENSAESEETENGQATPAANPIGQITGPQLVSGSDPCKSVQVEEKAKTAARYDALEAHLARFLPVICSRPDLGFPLELLTKLGDTPLDPWFVQRCELKVEQLRRKGWRFMLYLADDARNAYQAFRQHSGPTLEPPPGSRAVWVEGVEYGGAYTLTEARAAFASEVLSPGERAALLVAFPELEELSLGGSG